MTTYPTYVDLFRPAAKRSAALYDGLLIAGFTLMIALGAQLAVRLTFTPVPITGQTLAVLLTGALLGSRRGVFSVLLYLAEGSAGLPVFAGGMSGLGTLIGPTGGYLAGFIAAAYIVGWSAERGWDRRILTSCLLMTLGNAAVYAFGLPWLAFWVGPEHVLSLGFFPFLPGDLIKLIAGMLLLPAGWRLLGSGNIK